MMLMMLANIKGGTSKDDQLYLTVMFIGQPSPFYSQISLRKLVAAQRKFYCISMYKVVRI